MQIATDVLQEATQAALRFVPKKTTIPVYQHFLMDDRDGTLTVSAYDFQGSCRWDTQAESDGIYCTVPAELFAGDIKNISDDIVELSVKNNRLIVKTSRHTARFETLPGDEFVLSHHPDEWHNVDLSVIDALERCEIAVSEKTKPLVLTGVNLSVVNGMLYAMGTDAVRAGRFALDYSHNDAFDLTVPKGTANAMARASKDTESLQLATDGRTLALKTDNAVLTSQLLDGQYPDVSKLFKRDASHYTTAIASGETLLDALKQVRPFSKGQGDYILIIVEAGCVVLRAESENGISEIEIPATTSDEARVAMNLQYLYDYVNLARKIDITLRVGSEVEPVYLDGLDHFDYVAMPMKIRS